MPQTVSWEDDRRVILQPGGNGSKQHYEQTATSDQMVVIENGMVIGSRACSKSADAAVYGISDVLQMMGLGVELDGMNIGQILCIRRICLSLGNTLEVMSCPC